MLQHSHGHAFRPVLHRSLTVPAAHMGPQDSNFTMHLPRGTMRPSFNPLTSFHRATQKSCSSAKRGRWGAQHVCIAWKIYYHEQLKKMQQKPDSLHGELTPEYQHKKSDQSSCKHPNLDSPCGHSGEPAEDFRPSNKSYPSDLHASSPASCHRGVTAGEGLEKHLHLLCDDKLDEEEKHRSQQINITKDLPRRDKSWDQTATPGLDGRLGSLMNRKRKLERDSDVKAKRLKQETVEDSFDSSHTFPVRPISDLSVLYPNSSGCNVTRRPGGLFCYPGSQMFPYQTMWDSTKSMDLYWRQNILRGYSFKTSRIPPRLYFPLALRQQETVHLREREFLRLHQQSCHFHNSRYRLPHQGFLQTSHIGP